MAFYLSFREVWRNKGRFFLFSLVIALITILVLFVGGLAEGLSASNREYLDKLDADLLLFQDNVELSTNSSRIGNSKLNDIRRVEGVKEIGPLGFSAGTMVFADGREVLDVSLIGVDAGMPGVPPILEGETLRSNRGSEVIIDGKIASQRNVQIGDQIVVKTIQGQDESFYKLNVLGISGDQTYLYSPSIFVPYQTWEKIRPQSGKGAALVETISNVVAIQVQDKDQVEAVRLRIESQVSNVEVVDKETAIRAIPGYLVQQSTLTTQQSFSLLIGVLVIGGFFQIQTLQKVPQIGVLKAIGATNGTVAVAVVVQIILVTTFGVLIGGFVTWSMSLFIPDTVPLVLDIQYLWTDILALLAIGPIGGLVSVRLATQVEPLRALGLTS
ncbi:MAG: ABC transporter permease [Anaerolineaceae bacterium]|nr:ABC transporter permease [Anaerolineaceae bacterium]